MTPSALRDRRVLNVLPAALVVVSLLAGFFFSKFYLRETARQFAEAFQQQNASAIESGDVFTLSSRLDSVSSSIHWTCISAERGGQYFFRRWNGSCGDGLFQKEVVVRSANQGGLAISFTLRLPVSLELAGTGFLVLQVTLLGLLFVSVRQAERVRHEGQRLLAELATQVAHDIRSPLSALQSLLGRLNLLAPAERVLVESAVRRIQGIALDLLDRGRGVPARPTAPLAEMTAHVVAEKTTPGVDGLTIRWTPDERTRQLIVAVVETDFERILSNLLDNSIQALRGRGTIKIEVASMTASQVTVAVTDDGPGIPADVLPKLGRRGASFGKAHGNGLGLYHAKLTLESWGGGLTVSSEPGKGTTVSMTLPLAPATDAVPPSDAPLVVLVDDDPLVRTTWAMAAKRRGRTLRAFATAAEFLAAAHALDRAAPLYIDADLGDGETGADAARQAVELGFTEIFMATGHDPAAFSDLAFLRGVVGKDPPWA